MISFKSASEIQKYARERARVMYSKRMIKLVRCGYSRQLSSTCFLLFLFVYGCFSVTTFCSFFHLSHLSSFCFWLQNRPRRLVFSLFSIFGALVVFVVCDFDEKKETKFLTRDVVTVATHSYACESPFIHTHTLCIYLCNLQNPKSTLD